MIALIVFLISLLCAGPAHANYDPLSVPNNRYGIHIVDTNDIPQLRELVNTTGGDWGYVTMVLADSDRDHDRWQNIFNEMRRLHLIPIIRLATHVEGSVWVKPNKDRFYEITNLLNSLNWPTANRYIVLYNEPNHANEWGGAIDPADYADTFVTFANALKKANPDYFTLPAGLDASSADDEEDYLQKMIAARPEILTLMDGWTSHSYPNPGFSGSPYARGRGTLSTFDWELNYLQSLGLTKNLPVFITETGWERRALSAQNVAQNFTVAASSIWADPRIAAITPFIYKYLDVPFDQFSWKMIDNSGFYPQYEAYQQIVKTAGQPKQHESYSLLSDLLPGKLIIGSTYALSAVLTNSGQGIVDAGDGYTITLTSGEKPINIFVDPLPNLESGDHGQIMIHFKTPPAPGSLPLTLSLLHNNEKMLLQTRTVELVPPPSVSVRARLGWRANNDAPDVTILIYDKDTILQKFTGLSMTNGLVKASGLANIIPGAAYRVVTLVDGYLPRQVIGALGSGNTIIYPSRFLPLDFNGDGAFTFADIFALIHVSPWTATLRFFGP